MGRLEVHLDSGAVEEIPFAERLRALRSERGVTQQVLAEKAGLSRVSVTRIETGEQLPRYQTLVALAAALDLSVDRLLVG